VREALSQHALNSELLHVLLLQRRERAIMEHDASSSGKDADQNACKLQEAKGEETWGTCDQVQETQD
jgi:hypothetical protein